MMEIDPCLYRVLYWNILVQYQKPISIQLHHHVNVMQCFIISYLIIENRMLPILMNTDFFFFTAQRQKIIDNIIDFDIGKH